MVANGVGLGDEEEYNIGSCGVFVAEEEYSEDFLGEPASKRVRLWDADED